MRFRPANIRVINRRESRLDRDLRLRLAKILADFEINDIAALPPLLL
jgi:hypothetical protein